MDERFHLAETEEYERLVQFFVVNELEFDGDEEVDTDIVRCYKVTDDKDALVGAAVLAMREGRYIIDGIAVDPAFRKENIGRALLEAILKEVRRRGGDAIYLVARAPGFFRRNGFTTIDPEDAPNFFECKYCPQYQKNCFPEVMKREIA